MRISGNGNDLSLKRPPSAWRTCHNDPRPHLMWLMWPDLAYICNYVDKGCDTSFICENRWLFWEHTQRLIMIKIHPWRQSIVKTVDSDLRVYCYFVLVRSGTIYGFYHETACLIFHGLAILTMTLRFSISNLGIHAHILCIWSRRKLLTQLQ